MELIITPHTESRSTRRCVCDAHEHNREYWQEHYRRAEAESDEYEARTGRNLFMDRLSEGVK